MKRTLLLRWCLMLLALPIPHSGKGDQSVDLLQLPLIQSTPQSRLTAIAANNNQVVVGTELGEVYSFSLATGRLEKREPGSDEAIRGIQLNGASQYLDFSDDFSNVIEERTPNAQPRRYLRLSEPDSQLVGFRGRVGILARNIGTVSQSRRPEIQLRDMVTGEALGSFPIPESWKGVDSFHAAFSPDGKRLIVSSKVGIAMFQKGQSAPLWKQDAVKAEFYSVAFRPDGKQVAVGGDLYRVWGFDAALGTPQWIATVPKAPGSLSIGFLANIRSIAYSPNGDALAAAGETIALLDSKQGKLQSTIEKSVEELIFAPEGKRLVTCGIETVDCFDATSGKVIWNVGRAVAGVSGVAVDRDGTFHISLDNRDKPLPVRRWRVSGGELAVGAVAQRGEILGVTPDGEELLVNYDGLWKLDSAKAIRLQSEITSDNLAYSPKAQLLAETPSLSGRGRVRLWDNNGATLRHTINVSSTGLSSVSLALSPDGALLAIADDKETAIYRTDTGKRERPLLFFGDERTLLGGRDIPYQLAFTRDTGKVLGVYAAAVRQWDVATGKQLWVAEFDRGIRVRAPMGLSPDGATVAIAQKGGGVVCLDLATGKERKEISRFPAATFQTLAYTPEGDHIIGVAASGEVCLMEARTGALQARIWFREAGDWLVVDAQGRCEGTPGGLALLPGTRPDTGVLLAAMKSKPVLAEPTPAKSQTSPVAVVPQLASSTVGNALTFSPDGRMLVADNGALGVAFYDLLSRRLLRLWSTSDQVNSLDWTSPTEVAIVTQKNVQIRESASGELRPLPDIAGLREQFYGRPILSHDGKRVVLLFDGGFEVWDMGTGKSLQARKVPGLLAAAWSGDGKRFAIASATGIGIYEPPVQNPVATFPAVGYVPGDLSGSRRLALRLSQDGKTVSVTSHEKRQTTVFTEAAPGKPVGIAHTGGDSIVFSLADSLSPSGDIIATAREREITLWNAHNGQVRHRVALPDWIGALTFSPDESSLAATIRGGIALVNVSTGKTTVTLTGTVRPVLAMAASPDGNVLATGSDKGGVSLWNLRDGTRQRIAMGVEAVTSLAFSPDGKTLAIARGEEQPSLALWNLASNQALWSHPVTAAPKAVTGVVSLPLHLTFSAGTGEQLAFSLHGDPLTPAQVRLWDTRTGTERWRRELDKDSAVESIFFAAGNADLLVGAGNSAYSDVMLALDVASGQIRKRIVGGVEKQLTGIAPLANKTEFWNTQASGISPDNLWAVSLASRLDRRKLDSGEVIERIEGALEPDQVTVFDLVRKTALALIGHNGRVTAALALPDAKRVATASEDGTIRLWDRATGKELLELIGTDNDEFVAVTPSGYYRASRHALDSVAFRVGERAYPFEQFDLIYNRPDRVLEALGRNDAQADAFRAAVERRHRRAGLTNTEALSSLVGVPVLTVSLPGATTLTTSERRLSVPVVVELAEGRTLAELEVTINGVPTSYPTALTPNGKRRWSGTVDILLGTAFQGRNKIQISARDSAGQRSLAETIEATCTAPPSPRRLFVLSIGVSRYAESDYNLKYAAQDATDLAGLFKKSPARVFTQVETKPLTDADATRAAILEANSFLKQAGIDDTVVISVAGHGLLDREGVYRFAPHDMKFANPAMTGLSLEELERLFQGVAARQRLLLMDSCHAGEVDREATAPLAPGVISVAARGPESGLAPGATSPTFALLQELFLDLETRSGAEVIAASGGAQYAEERDGNGVFTAAVKIGIGESKADTNKDGQITVSELRAFVTNRVVLATGGRQRPTARRERPGFDFQLR